MAIKNWFKKKEEEPIREYSLNTMGTGYMVDYDLKTWTVTEYNTYNYDGSVSEEWVLSSGDEVRYLERSAEDGRVYWTLTEDLDFGIIEEDIARILAGDETTPEAITVEGETFQYLESGPGLYMAAGEGQGEDFVSWTYLDDSEEKLVCITQWGERDFKLCGGYYVDEYEFTNILPSGQNLSL